MHLMIDLETLGKDHDAPVLSIGAVFFNPNTGEMGHEFHVKIEFESACLNRRIDPSTVKWWLQQSKEAQSKLFEGNAAPVRTALVHFVEWVKSVTNTNNVKPWGNGATFDITMLESCLKTHCVEIPWKFWNIRDVRTIVDCAEPFVKRNSIKFDGVQHDALDDAKHQAKYISIMWQKLTTAG